MLPDGGQTRSFGDRARRIGFLPRGGGLSAGAVAVRIPDVVDGEASVCGLKAFLVDERRAFTLDDGRVIEVDCARVAVLAIDDAPVHVHGETVETYHILAGRGGMLLGARVIAVAAGDLVVIPPGTPHGAWSDDPARPLTVLMTFSPGLAPVRHAEARDERIVAPSARAAAGR